MTPQDRQLLLQELCARLPYGVKVKAKNTYAIVDMIDAPKSLVYAYQQYPDFCKMLTINGGGLQDHLPYLRPMSSMTDDEVKTEREIQQDCLFGRKPLALLTDFYYSRHLDVNLFIEKGLAVEAPKGMYV